MNSLKTSPYNLHGWKNDNVMLADLFSCSDLVFIQEHWLFPGNLNIITSCNVEWDCHVVSGITDIESYTANKSRPYGNLGFLWRKSAGLKVKLIGIENSHRVMVTELLSDNKKFIIVGVYLPCFVNSDEYKGF